jgi:hypothetical protein
LDLNTLGAQHDPVGGHFADTAVGGLQQEAYGRGESGEDCESQELLLAVIPGIEQRGDECEQQRGEHDP